MALCSPLVDVEWLLVLGVDREDLDCLLALQLDADTLSFVDLKLADKSCCGSSSSSLLLSSYIRKQEKYEMVAF